MPKIASIIRSLEPRPSTVNMHRSVIDLAIAKFDKPVHVHYGHRPVIWDSPTNSVRDKLYLLGGDRHGQRETLPQNVEQAQKVTSARRGGWFYLLETLCLGESADYQKTPAVIWRCSDSSITGDSGGLLVSAGDEHDRGFYQYHVAGFQSHQLDPNLYPRQDPFMCWKVAYAPPANLKQNYIAVAPAAVCRQLDLRIAQEKYVFCLSLLIYKGRGVT